MKAPAGLGARSAAIAKTRTRERARVSRGGANAQSRAPARRADIHVRRQLTIRDRRPHVANREAHRLRVPKLLRAHRRPRSVRRRAQNQPRGLPSRDHSRPRRAPLDRSHRRRLQTSDRHAKHVERTLVRAAQNTARLLCLSGCRRSLDSSVTTSSLLSSFPPSLP
jgi:hypothetical protein